MVLEGCEPGHRAVLPAATHTARARVGSPVVDGRVRGVPDRRRATASVDWMARPAPARSAATTNELREGAAPHLVVGRYTCGDSRAPTGTFLCSRIPGVPCARQSRCNWFGMSYRTALGRARQSRRDQANALLRWGSGAGNGQPPRRRLIVRAGAPGGANNRPGLDERRPATGRSGRRGRAP